MIKKYLVSGAAGFIGAAIATDLVKSGHEVWTIDNLATGFTGNIPDGVEFVKGNCQDDSSIKSLKKTKFDGLIKFIHFYQNVVVIKKGHSKKSITSTKNRYSEH